MHWDTVSPALQEMLHFVMRADEFSAFRLVGGTALSLQLGHRLSVDIDLFTDAPYGSIDFDRIDSFLQSTYPYVGTSFGLMVSMGRSYRLGANELDALKLDVFYTTDPFMRDLLAVEGVRMATLDEIAAMKIEVVQHGGRKKDFWDIHELLDHFSIERMIALHEERYPYTHDEAAIRKNLSDFTKAEEDLDPVCLKGKYWEFIKADFEDLQA